MDIQTQNEISETPGYMQGFYSSVSSGFGLAADNPNAGLQAAKPSILQKDRPERLKQAVNDLNIGKRIHAELKRQGRTVSWLAKQLDVERTSLYYTFRQNSIDVELLLRISCFMEHNFLQDVADVFKAYGL